MGNNLFLFFTFNCLGLDQILCFVMEIEDIHKIVEEKFQTNSSKIILAIYLFGSRLHGNAKKDSDYDFVVVLDYPEVNEMIDIIYKNLKVGIHLIDEKVLYSSIESHLNAVTLHLVWIPKDFILVEHERIKKFRSKFVPDIKLLQYGTVKESKLLFAKSKRLFLSDRNKSLKSLIHGIRFLLFAIQIVSKGGIKDFSEANSYQKEILELKFEKWEEYKEKYKPIYDELDSKLFKCMLEEKMKIYDHYKSPKNSKLAIIDVIKDLGVNSLKRLLSHDIKDLGNGLKRISLNEKLSNKDHYVTNECTHLIINNSTEIVSYGFKRINLIDEKIFNQSNDLIITKYHHQDYYLYFYEKEWRLYSKDSDKFWKIWKDLKLDYPNDTDKTFIFNIFNKYIYLIGVRDIKTLKEDDPKNFKNYKTFQEEKFNNYNEMELSLCTIDFSFSGYYIRTADFQTRWKYEAPYLNHSSNFVFNSNIFEERTSETEINSNLLYEMIKFHWKSHDLLKEFLSKEYPSLIQLFEKNKDNYDKLCEKMNQNYSEIIELSQQDFYKKTKTIPIYGRLFNIMKKMNFKKSQELFFGEKLKILFEAFEK